MIKDSWMIVIGIVALIVPLSSNSQNAAIPALSEEPGQSSIRAPDGSYGVELIDPFTGALKIVATDLHVPSNGGLDLSITRNYVSLQRPNTTVPGYLPGRTATGIGWDVHFGRVWRAGAAQGYTLPASNCTGVAGGVNASDSRWNPVLELPDGSRQVLVTGDSGKPYQFITVERWIGQCVGSGDGGLLVTSPQGIRYTFNRLGRVADGNFNNSMAFHPTRIEHPNGTFITITYAAISDPSVEFLRINTVTHSEGHSLTFTYLDPGTRNARLRTIRLNGAPARTWTYDYGVAFTAGGASHHYLTRVTRPDNERFDYAYYGSGTGQYSLQRITTPLNATVTYTYQQQLFPRHLEGAIPRIVVRTKQVAGNVDASGTWTYTYTPASTASATTDQTQVAGPGNCVIYEHQSATTANNQLWRIGLLLNKTTGASCGGANLRREVYTWGSATLAGQAYWRPPNVIDQDTYAPRLDSTAITQDGTTYTTAYSQYDEWGNARQVVESGQDSRTRVKTFLNNTSAWIVQRLRNETINNAGTIHPAGTVGNYAVVRNFHSNGNLQNESHAGVQTSYTWHTSGTSRGEINTITDAQNNTVAFTNYRRGTSQNESHPLGVTIGRAVGNTGVVENQTDPRGRQTWYTYDAVDELTGIQTPRTTDDDVSIIRAGADQRILTRGTYRETRSYDGFGNLRQIHKADLTSGRATLHLQRLDARGRVVRVYLPVESGTPTQFDSIEYDALGRRRRVTHVDGTTIDYDYLSGNRVEVTDERGFKTTYTYRSYGTPDQRDLVGIVTQAGDSPGTSNSISTTIQRNKIGQVTAVTQGGLTRSYRYDSRFLLYQELDPELGTITYGRDAVGNLTSRSVGSSGVTNYVLDDLYRIDLITFPSGSGTPSVDFDYYADGSLRFVTRGTTRWDYGYDLNNNLETETLTVDGRTYGLVNTYDGRDALATVRYPSGLTIDYAPNGFGQPTQVVAGGTTYASNLSYYPNGQPREYTLGNGYRTQFGQNDRLRPTTLRSTRMQGGVDALHLEYAYDPTGNVRRIDDHRDGTGTKVLTYDGANRLRTASGRWGNASFAYDARHNITTKQLPPQNLTYVYNATGGRLTGITGTRPMSFGYDVYGNITSNGRNEQGYGVFAYDAASNLTQVGNPAKITYAYDGHDRMTVEIRAGTGMTRYSIYDRAGRRLYEETAGSQTIDYLYLGSTLLASRTRATSAPAITPSSTVLNSAAAGVVLTVDIGGIAPGGTVTFTENGAFLGVAPVSNARASVQIQGLSLGTHTIVASYSGDAANAPSSTAFQVRVQNLAWLPAVLDQLLEVGER